MSEIKKESDLCEICDCSNKKAVIKYNNDLCDDVEYRVNYCENHICAVRFCEKNRMTDTVHTCEFHTCSKCLVTLEYLPDNGIWICRTCFRTYQISLLKKFLIACGLAVGSYLFFITR